MVRGLVLWRERALVLIVGQVVGLGCDGPASAPDAPGLTVADAPPDLSLDALPPRCDPSKPFGAPVALDAVNTAAYEDGAFLTQDELTLYFGSTRSGGAGDWDLYQAVRASTSLPFDAPLPVPGVDTALCERWPAISADGLMLYATRVTAQPYETDILSSTRTSIAVPFPPLFFDPAFNSAYRDEGLFLLPDRTAIWGSFRPTNHPVNYIAEWNGSSYLPPVPIVMFPGDPSEAGSMVMTADHLTLYFSSTHAMSGGDDIWRAHRADPSQPFDAPVLVPELSTPGSEEISWVSGDGCVVALTHYNVGTNTDMYLATKPL